MSQSSAPIPGIYLTSLESFKVVHTVHFLHDVTLFTNKM